MSLFLFFVPHVLFSFLSNNLSVHLVSVCWLDGEVLVRGNLSAARILVGGSGKVN